MDFIFMLTRGDKTVTNSFEMLEIGLESGVTHIGFKDVGVDKRTLAGLAKRIKEAGAVSYMEVVSTTSESILDSIQTAAEIGIDRVLGGQDIEAALDILKGSGAHYFPFPGRPVGHPTDLGGSAEEIAADCARIRAAGCPGVDLLAYRATEADPLDLIRAARAGLGDGYLIVAGSIDSPERIQAIADAGTDAFTIGTAVFDFTFTPGLESIEAQCRDVLAACGSTAQ